MGVRLALRKELMGIDSSSFLAADDVRKQLKQAASSAPDKAELGFKLISRFNDNHSHLSHGGDTKEQQLEYQHHRLFKEVLYTQQSVVKWASMHGMELTL